MGNSEPHIHGRDDCMVWKKEATHLCCSGGMPITKSYLIDSATLTHTENWEWRLEM